MPTTNSVPEAQSAHVAEGALSRSNPLIDEMIRAAEALAALYFYRHTSRTGEITTTCSRCHDPLPMHAPSCAVGQVLRAAEDLRANSLRVVVSFTDADVAEFKQAWESAANGIPASERAAASRILAEAVGSDLAVPEDDLAAPVVESDESWEASEALLALRADLDGSRRVSDSGKEERRVVCGAEATDVATMLHTCDRTVGHDGWHSDSVTGKIWPALSAWPDPRAVCDAVAIGVAQ